MKCQGNNSFSLDFINDTYHVQQRITVGFDQRHHAIMQFASNKDEFGLPIEGNSDEIGQTSKKKVDIKAVLDAHSPDIGFDGKNRLTTISNAIFDVKIDDKDLFQLPQMQVAALKQLLPALPENVSRSLQPSFDIYIAELANKDIRFIPGILSQAFDPIAYEFQHQTLGDWLTDPINIRFKNVCLNHGSLMDHAPKHEEFLKLIADIDLDVDTEIILELIEALKPLLEMLPELVEKEIIHPDLENLLKFMKEQLDNAVFDQTPNKDKSIIRSYGTIQRIKDVAKGSERLGEFVKKTKPVWDLLEKIISMASGWPS